MIKTDVIGHLGVDATVNDVNGKQVINFSLAHSESYKDAQGVKHEKTLWVRCAYWTDRVGILPYLKKGTLIFVTGQPEVSIYTDRAGRPQAEFKLRVGQIQLLGSKNENSGGNMPQNSGNRYSDIEPTQEQIEDVPF